MDIKTPAPSQPAPVNPITPRKPHYDRDEDKPKKRRKPDDPDKHEDRLIDTYA